VRSGDVSVSVDLHCHILPGLDDGARDLEAPPAQARAGALAIRRNVQHGDRSRAAIGPNY
jgi:hypothetical protein